MKVYRISWNGRETSALVSKHYNDDNTGKLPARLSNQRYYTEDQYLDYIGMPAGKPHRKWLLMLDISRNQRDDLKHQIDFIRTFFANARGAILDECGWRYGWERLNYNRPNELPSSHDEIATIYVTYKDRFIRFGFAVWKPMQQHQTEIVVLKPDEETSPDKELFEDLTSIYMFFLSFIRPRKIQESDQRR